ncbi:hypothetical protein CONPUDRAFT_99121 [Coniophora puteana RWD-64-598 SS2]|uniref:3-oxo-5-alpha-steroid 4-dehydrogenase C-terminal domain-containing protein n=1 Tax=Coniophora puteana (strain RWD-64-598) TaxID=741705 RepID=A0A5M3MWT1_CONPW|nr:uncharacterized protein CONPUDRAFT_99121 [Coniophora puteana RWD-64-598 SS2]EIW83603.1 hypothetical protein CONPUDRAFT_99121 [Coniophora puteana RWD-64-598 SS2]
MVSITVQPAGRPVKLAKGLPIKVDLPGKDVSTATVGDVKAALVAKFPRFTPSRQRISAKGDNKLLPPETTLLKAGIVDGDEVTVKDLGPQISWQFVFVVEYAGPLLIHPLFYHFSKLFYGVDQQHSTLQKFVYTWMLLHFAKREVETLFVHRFSHDTMPFLNIFKNSAHYWIFSGAFLAYALYSPTYAATSPYILGTVRNDPKFLWACTAVWAWAELSNAYTHLKLRALRPPGTRTRAVATGYGFDLVSFPNYLFESIAWTVVALMTGSWAAWFFLAIGAGQMYLWGVKKHRAYKREFGDKYPKGRKVMIPFLL